MEATAILAGQQKKISFGHKFLSIFTIISKIGRILIKQHFMSSVAIVSSTIYGHVTMSIEGEKTPLPC